MITSVAVREPILDLIGPSSPWGAAYGANSGMNPGSTTFENATRTVYYPFFIPTTCVLKRFWWANGAAVAGNVLMAVYSATAVGRPGARIGTNMTSTAQAGTNVLQFGAPSGGDIVLTPQPIWIAIAVSSTSAQLFVSGGASTATVYRMMEATGTPPATATPVTGGGNNWYICGFSTVSSP
jgi:hypothetical protein